MSRSGLLVAATLLSIVGAPARAHHSFAAEFDATKSGELKGRVTGVWFNNPHVRFRNAVRVFPPGSFPESA